MDAGRLPYAYTRHSNSQTFKRAATKPTNPKSALAERQVRIAQTSRFSARSVLNALISLFAGVAKALRTRNATLVQTNAPPASITSPRPQQGAGEINPSTMKALGDAGANAVQGNTETRFDRKGIDHQCVIDFARQFDLWLPKGDGEGARSLQSVIPKDEDASAEAIKERAQGIKEQLVKFRDAHLGGDSALLAVFTMMANQGTLAGLSQVAPSLIFQSATDLNVAPTKGILLTGVQCSFELEEAIIDKDKAVLKVVVTAESGIAGIHDLSNDNLEELDPSTNELTVKHTLVIEVERDLATKEFERLRKTGQGKKVDLRPGFSPAAVKVTAEPGSGKYEVILAGALSSAAIPGV